MDNMNAAECELAAFLKANQEAELKTWNRRRTTEELLSFLQQKLAKIDNEDLYYFLEEN